MGGEATSLKESAPLIASGIAALALLVTIIGYYYNAEQGRKLERFKLKAEAYSNFLAQVELLLPEKDGEVLSDNNKIRELNKALTILLVKAPGCVVTEINDKLLGGDRSSSASLDRSQMKKLQLILHNDLNDEASCPAVRLQEGDFPHFPFK